MAATWGLSAELWAGPWEKLGLAMAEAKVESARLSVLGSAALLAQGLALGKAASEGRRAVPKAWDWGGARVWM